jgi:hypothetical protein
MEPAIIFEEFSIMMKKVEGIDTEKRRIFLFTDIENGFELSDCNKRL